MKRTLLLSIAVFVFTTGIISAEILFDNGIRYEVAYLGSFIPTSLNDSGQVVGYTNETSERAVLWDSINGMQYLGELDGYKPGGSETKALDINNSGQVVGESGHNAFIWDNINGMQRLGEIGTIRGGSCATAINDLGQVVGYSGIAGGGSDVHAVLWENGNIIDLGTLGFSESRANDINNSGQIVGVNLSLINNATQGHAFLWDSQNGMQDIHPSQDDLSHIPYENPAWTSGAVINDSGAIGVDFPNVSFLLENDTWTFIVGPEGAAQSYIYGINTIGVIVGENGPGGWVWNETIIYQGAYGYDDYFVPADINNNGQIVCRGLNFVYGGAFLLSPVPEPCTVLLLGLGGMLIRKR